MLVAGLWLAVMRMMMVRIRPPIMMVTVIMAAIGDVGSETPGTLKGSSSRD
jgi:hypothetical protein